MLGFWQTDNLSIEQIFNDLIYAIKSKDNYHILGVIEAHPDIFKYFDKDRNTPLHHAAIHGCSEIVFDKILEKSCADAKNNEEHTPLYYLKKEGRDTLVARFLAITGIDETIAPQKELLTQFKSLSLSAQSLDVSELNAVSTLEQTPSKEKNGLRINN